MLSLSTKRSSDSDARLRIASYVDHSLMLVTALTPKIGFDNAAKIARTAYENDCSLREACLMPGYLTGDEFDAIVIPEYMVGL